MGRKEIVLARLCLEWLETKNRLEYLEQAIEGPILDREETYTIPGVVRATYYKPGLKYDYEAGAKQSERDVALIEQAIKDHTKIREYVSWAKVVEELGVPEEEIPSEKRPARVSIKAE